MPEIYCRTCGQAAQPDDRFCRRCGSPLGPSSASGEEIHRNLSQMDFSKLIPELSQWDDGKGINIDAWLSIIGNFPHAIAYGQLFWPEFVEYDGCLFRLDAFTPGNYESWFEETNGDKTSIELVINHLHMGDLFPNAPGRTSAQEIYLARLLKEMWECKAKHDFPDLEVEVKLFDCEADGEDWTDCQISLFRRR